MFLFFKRILIVLALVSPLVAFGSAGSAAPTRNSGERAHEIMKKVIRRMIEAEKCFEGDASWLDTSPREYNQKRNDAFNEYYEAIRDTNVTTRNALLMRKYKAEVEREFDKADEDKKAKSEALPVATAVVIKASEAASAPTVSISAAAVTYDSQLKSQAPIRSAELKYSKEVVPAIDWTQKKYKDQLALELEAIKDVKYKHTPKQLTWGQVQQMSKKSTTGKKVKSKEKNGILEFYRNNKVLVGACLGAVTGAVQIALFKKYIHNCPNSLPSNAATAPFVGLGVLAGSAAGYFDVLPGAFVGANIGGIAGRLLLEPTQGGYYKGDRQAPALLGGLIAGGIASATDTELPSALGAAGCVAWHYSKGDSKSVSVSTAPVGALMGTGVGYAGKAIMRRRKINNI